MIKRLIDILTIVVPCMCILYIITVGPSCCRAVMDDIDQLRKRDHDRAAVKKFREAGFTDQMLRDHGYDPSLE